MIALYPAKGSALTRTDPPKLSLRVARNIGDAKNILPAGFIRDFSGPGSYSSKGHLHQQGHGDEFEQLVIDTIPIPPELSLKFEHGPWSGYSWIHVPA